jgi:hypothetical protein
MRLEALYSTQSINRSNDVEKPDNRTGHADQMFKQRTRKDEIITKYLPNSQALKALLWLQNWAILHVCFHLASTFQMQLTCQKEP